MDTLGIRIQVNSETDSEEELLKLFYDVMETVCDSGYSVVTGSLNCELFFDLDNNLMGKPSLKKFSELYQKVSNRGNK